AGEALSLPRDFVVVDVASFERSASSAAPRDLERAVRAYRGDFLEGLVTGEDGFEAWLAAERERLRAVAILALDRLLERRSAMAAPTAARVAMRLLALDPLREDVHRLLMRVYAGQGRRAAAIRQYERCAAVLGRDLGVGPEPETLELHRALLA